MEPQSDLLTAPWLKPIMSLIRDHNFDEAYALAEYFPATPARKLTQCAVLLSLDNLAQADTILNTIDVKIQTLVPDFVYLLIKVDIDLLGVGRTAIRKKHLYVGYLCLESYLLTHPKAVQPLIDDLIELVAQTLTIGDLDLCRTCLDRAVELDNSPASLIHYAGIVVNSNKLESTNPLSEFARDLLNRALTGLSEEDVDDKLKIATLLASFDANTFKAACILFRQLLQEHPYVSLQISELLSPLIDSRPYFNDIADFLLEVDPGNVASLTQQLVAAYRRSRDQMYLRKAESLLDVLDYASQGYSSQFAKAVLIVGQVSYTFDVYARRLADMELDPDVAIDVAQTLVNREPDEYSIVIGFLEQALRRDPSKNVSAIAVYAHLSELTQDRGQGELHKKYLTRAVDLSRNLREFLEQGAAVNRRITFLV